MSDRVRGHVGDRVATTLLYFEMYYYEIESCEYLKNCIIINLKTEYLKKKNCNLKTEYGGGGGGGYKNSKN